MHDGRVKTQALRVLARSLPTLYDSTVDRHGCKVFTVRRYNRRVIDFAGIRNKTLEIIKTDRNLPLNTECNVKVVDSECMRCRKSFAVYPAVTYLHCGHSCLCTDCDETVNVDNTCPKCKSGIRYKLKYKTL
ncbi:ac44 [Troides aeacus nucleopolyhedrovirus]|nr:ac44 [Troides aeacus nucleopolyhedrovirus]